MAAGYNGARLHQKVFEPRFLYWADKLGYLVWGEFPNWGYNYQPEGYAPYVTEWTEVLLARSQPSGHRRLVSLQRNRRGRPANSSR